jgi:cytoskeletal protein RodZ
MAGPNRETVGQYLRRERESRSVSLQELSKNTRINVTFLEALERDDFGALPRQEFIPGFLQGYARQLGLKAEEVLRRYRIQVEWAGRKEKFQQIPLFPGTAPPREEEEEANQNRKDPIPSAGKRRVPWKTLVQIVIVLLALGLSLYLHRLMKSTDSREQASDSGAVSRAKGK